jgi:multicomponent Na+:H+ antiporter subunit D
MNLYVLVLPILLPFIGGAILPLLHLKSRKSRQWYVGVISVLTSIITFAILMDKPEGTLRAINLAGNLEVSFHLDGLGSVFAGIIAGLWPIATLYSFEYMKHEEKETKFFTFYTMTYGVTMGLTFSSNLMTMYMFYEMLTLITLPLVMHSMNKKSILAGRKYIFYSIGGAAFAFIGFIFIYAYGNGMAFEYGGVLDLAKIGNKEELLRFVYVLAVLGFGVKAAIFPFHGWLPRAAVAPTPVTALLHAVAVVKAGAFAIMRITYYSFGTDFLYGSWAQDVLLIFALATILYGSSRALKEQHLKRRLAYSTISNLSYIVFGIALMTPAGLTGSLTHMVCHAVIKITLFFCGGSIMYMSKKEYVHEVRGIGKKMPVVMSCFVVASLGLIGVPPLAGFVSKFNLATAATYVNSPFAFIGILVLIISALLTSVYLFTVIIRAFFPGRDFDLTTLDGIKDPNWNMKLPLIILCAAIIILGIYSTPLVDYLTKVATGLI